MRDPEIVERLKQQVLELVTETPEASRRFIASEILRATELLRSVHDEPA